MDGWGVSTFGWGVYSVLPNIVTFVVTRVGGTQRAPTILFFEPGTRVMRRKVSGAVVDERRDPPATGRGPRRRRGGASTAPPPRPVVRGGGWRAGGAGRSAGRGVDEVVGEVGLFGAVDLATVVSV